MKKRTHISVVLIVLMLAAVSASAQDKVEWSVNGPEKTLKPGEKFAVTLIAKIADGWHMYSFTQPSGGPSTSQATLSPEQPFKLSGSISGALPHKAYDPNFEMETESYEGLANFSLPLAVGANAPSGTQNVAIEVRFQVCNETTCLPPKTVHLSAPVKIAAGAKAVAGAVPKAAFSASPASAVSSASPAEPQSTAGASSSVAVEKTPVSPRT